MDNKQREAEIVESTNALTRCATCGHARDWHSIGDVFYELIFGTRLGKCAHYNVKGQNLPMWKRKKIYCECKEFIPQRETKK
jgi:hypothetical protein